MAPGKRKKRRRISPMQVAAQLLEEAVEKCPGGG
jgi:hypothetical protein